MTVWDIWEHLRTEEQKSFKSSRFQTSQCRNVTYRIFNIKQFIGWNSACLTVCILPEVYWGLSQKIWLWSSSYGGTLLEKWKWTVKEGKQKVADLTSKCITEKTRATVIRLLSYYYLKYSQFISKYSDTNWSTVIFNVSPHVFIYFSFDRIKNKWNKWLKSVK